MSETNRVEKWKGVLTLITLVAILGTATFFLVRNFGSRAVNIGEPGAEREKSGESPVSLLEKSPLSGRWCEDAERRPVAVMMAGDSEVRPLSGIGEADMVVEMPVVEDSITRYMAVFICGNPDEIGSLRSARDDFIPLAMGLDAIYAHWGGSRFALEQLSVGVIDNIDALINPFDAFYRKSGILRPHNGFSSVERLLNSADKLGYRLQSRLEAYPHIGESQHSSAAGTLVVGYPSIFRVRYEYDPEENVYSRFRGDTPQKDRLTGEQIKAKVVAVLKTKTRHLEGQYNDVEVLGAGELLLYQNGGVIRGFWNKSGEKNRLLFLDKNGKEIPLESGQIWVQYIGDDQETSWLSER